jgi:hypothetical protein
VGTENVGNTLSAGFCGMNSLSASSVDIVEIPEELVGVDRELAPGGGIK